MAGEDWKSFVRIPVRPWEGRLNFLSVDFPLMIGLRGVDYLLLALFGFCNFRVRKGESFLDSKIFVAKTFRIKPVNCIIFQIRDKYA